jgi:acetyl/propionyl-CoA carboxylase alpha subunit
LNFTKLAKLLSPIEFEKIKMVYENGNSLLYRFERFEE